MVNFFLSFLFTFLSRLFIGYDFYQSIKLVNFIRGQTVAQPLKESEKFTLGEVPQFVEGDEQYLQPIIPEDPLLMTLGNFDDEEEGFGGASVAPAPQGSGLRINQSINIVNKVMLGGLTTPSLSSLGWCRGRTAPSGSGSPAEASGD